MGFGIGCLGMTWGRPALVVAGFGGGLFHLFNHALFKCLLFYAAGAIYRATHTVDLERLGGLLRRLPQTAWLFLLGGVAISALPPLNGFMSELIIYSGLLSGAAPSASANAALVTSAALLAFVGAVSALSMIRAFGVVFLGRPRDPSIHVTAKTPLSMTAPMYLHALGIVALGLYPAAGIALTRSVVVLFAVPGVPTTDASVIAMLAPVQVAVRVLVALVLIACVVGLFLTRGARRHVTWGCGYTAGNTRMQYTASSFSAPFAQVFEAFLPQLRRDRIATDVFPAEAGHIGTHHVDPVERRMFEVLGQGEQMITQASDRIPEQPRYAFAAGLLALVIAVGLLIGAGR
jgi:hydrogenase-4 component B